MTPLHRQGCTTTSDLDGRLPVRLTLFVSGATAHSATAIGNARTICDTHLGRNGLLSVIDVNDDRPIELPAAGMAVPSLVRSFPPPVHTVSGDLSDTDRVLDGLSLPTCRCLADGAAPAPVLGTSGADHDV